MSWFTPHTQDIAYSFLSILFEGIPFLLLGSVISGVVDVFVSPERMSRMLPGKGTGSILLSGLLGLIFPMCECGSVIVIRRFIKKGLPLSPAVTYMLASPIVSPIVAISTYAAFRGKDPWVMTVLRLVLGYALAVGVGLILACKNYVMELDELQQKIYLNALGITVGVAVVGSVPYSVMGRYHVMPFHAEISDLLILMSLTFAVSIVYGSVRYR